MLKALIAIIYAAFVSLGLPDAVIGAAWPRMATDFGVGIAAAGVCSVIISGGTILASFASSWLLPRLGTLRVTSISVALTALALAGFSAAPNFVVMVLLCVPLGLGAGAVDAALNAYVSQHYSAMHMNFLHASWGIGALAGPLAVGAFLQYTQQWRPAYVLIAVLQASLWLVLIVSRNLWEPVQSARSVASRASVSAGDAEGDAGSMAAEKLRDIQAPHASAVVDSISSSNQPWYTLPLVWPSLIAFLCYCALEATAGFWASTFLVQHHGLPVAVGAGAGAAFYIGLTVGRVLAGIFSLKLSNTALLRFGGAIALVGICMVLAPEAPIAVAGFLISGFGCAPIYPAIIKEIGRRLGNENVSRIVGIHMGFAYIGGMAVPPIVGLLMTQFSPLMMPAIVAGLVVLMLLLHEYIERQLTATSK